MIRRNHPRPLIPDPYRSYEDGQRFAMFDTPDGPLHPEDAPRFRAERVLLEYRLAELEFHGIDGPAIFVSDGTPVFEREWIRVRLDHLRVVLQRVLRAA